jgi:hypothetical protein
MKTFLQIICIAILTRTNLIACQTFDLGIYGTAIKSYGIIEIEVLRIKDSSEWKMYPNGFNNREAFRQLLDCKIIQSSIPELADSVRLTFFLDNSDHYDSLGNFEMSICKDIMHSGLEFNMQKGEKYVVLVQKHPLFEEGKREWFLLRAEKIGYNRIYNDFVSAKMINQYLSANYKKTLDKEFLKFKVFSIAQQKINSKQIESILYYNPLIKKFVLIEPDNFIESEVIEFDLESKPLRIENEYFIIFTNEKKYRLRRDNLKIE